MSHIVEIETTVKNKEFIANVCQELNIRTEQVTNFKFYDGTVKSGTALYLKNWKYPVVIEENGKVFFDNYENAWGDIKEYHEFVNHYSLAEVKEKLDQQRIKYTVKKENGKFIVEATA